MQEPEPGHNLTESFRNYLQLCELQTMKEFNLHTFLLTWDIYPNKKKTTEIHL